MLKIFIKITLTAVAAGALLISGPAHLAQADDKGTGEKTTKTEKKEKTEKTEKTEKKADKPAGGGW